MAEIKSVPTPESQNVNGYRRGISAGNITIPVNSRSIQAVVGDSTMPMQTTIECTPSRQRKGKQTNYPGMLSSPCNYKVTRTRASADEIVSAAQHSPTLESYYSDSTLKHPAFTGKQRRGDQEEES